VDSSPVRAKLAKCPAVDDIVCSLMLAGKRGMVPTDKR